MRLFIALPLEGEIARALSSVQDGFRRAGIKGNYTRPENFHLTLAFVGEYGNPDAVLDAMSAARPEPFRVALDGLGAFDGVRWAGVTVPESLFSYVRRLRHELSVAHIPFDGKKFTPHVTLIREPSRDGIPAIAVPRASNEIEGVSLMRSDRGKSGVIYTEIGFVK